MTEPSLFPDLDPGPRPPALGSDAQRTLRQDGLIARGFNPGIRLRLHPDATTGRTGDGLRCRDCRHLYRTGAGASDFLKCALAGAPRVRGEWGPDFRAWWPACTRFEPNEGASRG